MNYIYQRKIGLIIWFFFSTNRVNNTPDSIDIIKKVEKTDFFNILDNIIFIINIFFFRIQNILIGYYKINEYFVYIVSFKRKYSIFIIINSIPEVSNYNCGFSKTDHC
jgi:hypothetical protein